VQPDASDLAGFFQVEHLPAIEALAGEMGVDFRVVDVSKESPHEIGITPLVVFQNFRGRSIYQGRYATIDRIRNFVRTSRVMPQGKDPLKRKNLPVWNLPKANVACPIKITELTGSKPALFKAETFSEKMRAALAGGFKTFKMQEQVALTKSDRMFYMDFYPHRSDDGRFYLGVALFSQFHCHEPIYKKTDEPFAGNWDQRKMVFQSAAAELESQVKKFVTSSKIGDGFDPLAAGSKPTTWDKLGLSLPAKPENASPSATANIQLGPHWTVDPQSQQKRPAVQFAFPSPLEAYSGEATELTGTLNFGKALHFKKASGKFVVPVTSVTMGESDLDMEIHTSMLNGSKHPESDFIFSRIVSDQDKLAFGQVIAAKLPGRFTMKGITIDLTVPVSIEAFIGEDAAPRISITGAWSIHLADPYGLTGPDGPPEASDTLIYHCHIILKPK
jgi:polyisoprenoid-binding protein YceI